MRVVDRNGYATVYEYDKNGNRSAVKYANGIVVSYKYDEVNRLISEKALDKQGGLVAQYEYTLGAAGERTKVKELDRTVEYTYDSLYRLTGEKITAADKTVTEYTYAYDKVSNRILKTENGTKTTYTYNALNQLVKENDTVYKYDDAGNLISTTSSGKSAAYTYNAENKLIRATVNEAGKTVVEEYSYDFAGNRTSKTTGTETVKYLNDNSVLTNVLAELDANGNELCYYTIGADLISQERSGKTSLYLYDGHGSVRGLIDENGKVTDTYNYDAFGNLLDKTGTTVNNYLYCGEQFDSATGLYYLRARYMNPATGTFITQDTYSGTVFDPTSLHKYLYANANPVMNTDPSGYFSLGDFNAASSINSILDNSANMSSQFALKFFKNFMKKVTFATIGGAIAVGDQLAAGVTDRDQLAIAFRKGFLTGFAFSFATGKVAVALGSIGVIGGFAGAIKSFKDGNFWQGIYRLSLSTLGSVGLYKNYASNRGANTAKSSAKNNSAGMVTVRRVQGGIDPSGNKVSQGRITVNPDGSISIIGDDMLYVSIDNGEHSIYFLNNKRGGVGDIVEFNIPKWLFDFINGEAIPQAGATANPGYQNGMAPQIVDPTMPGNAYGLPDPWIGWLMEYATNGKVTSYQ